MDGTGEQKNFGFNNLDIDVLTREEIIELLNTIKDIDLKEQDLRTKLEYQKLRVMLFKKTAKFAKELADQSHNLYSQTLKRIQATTGKPKD